MNTAALERIIGRVRRSAVGCAALVAASGCSGNREQDDPSASAASSTGEASGDASSSTDRGSATTSDGTQRFDLGSLETETGASGGESSAEACKKIDFLFVIDNSASMGDEQQNLVDAFAGFIATIRANSGARDYHIAVVDTDAYMRPETLWQNCDPYPDCCADWCAANPEGLCDGYPCNEPASCDDRLGAAKTEDRFGEPCGLDGGLRFMTDAELDLERTFACVAKVGTYGFVGEKTMEAMVRAVGPETGPGGCHEGFVREDAILVVVVITDEEDVDEDLADACTRGFKASAGDPSKWFDGLVEAKRGAEENIVLLSLVGPVDAPCDPLDKCMGGELGAEPAPRILELTAMFTNGLAGPVCAPGYDDFFAEAVGLIDNACEHFIPPA